MLTTCHSLNVSYHADANGNVTALTDANQNITSSYQYGAYGLEGMVGNDMNKYRYVGVYGVAADDDTGLVYMWNRWYDPVSKRFVNEDPVGYLDGINMHRYARNDGINAFDPFGLCGVSTSTMPTRIGIPVIGPMVGVLQWANYTNEQGKKYGWPYAHVLANAGITSQYGSGWAYIASEAKEILDLIEGGYFAYSGLIYGYDYESSNVLYSAYQKYDHKMNAIGRSIPPGVNPETFSYSFRYAQEGSPGMPFEVYWKIGPPVSRVREKILGH